VLDGTDAVMLSAETAAGDFPEETIKAMVRIIIGAEKHPTASRSTYRVEERFGTIDESIAMASMYTANHLSGVKAIIALTQSGATPRLMSRIGSQLPIFAFSERTDTQRRVALYRGVQPVPFATGSNPGHASYCASKAGLHGLTRAVAIDHGGDGVRCNAVAPGWIDTELNEDFIESMDDPAAFRRQIGGIHPAGRTGSPAEVAALVAFLASEEAAFITGEIYRIDGGRMAKLSLP
jgi:pyruvate kinase